MVKKWFGIRNAVTTINASVSKVAKLLLAGAIALLSTIKGRETVDLSESQKEFTIRIRMTWHEILVLIIYEMIILIAIILVVELVKDVYRLCNFNSYRCQTALLNKLLSNLIFVK